MSSLRITGGTHTSATLELDGTDISNATKGLTLTMRAGHLPVAVLEVPVTDLSTETQADVRISDEVCELLVGLGWTPPGEGG